MTTDSAILLVIAEQRQVIETLRAENAELRRRLAEVETPTA